MQDYLIEMLQCPACGGELAWTITERSGECIELAEVNCTACPATYPVRQGIGLFLTPDLPRNDLWEQVESQLSRHLREHPQVERELIDVPPGDLAPADQFFRATVMEERGEYVQARAIAEQALAGLYTPAYLACYESQIRYVVEALSTADGPVVDLASGRGRLIEALAETGERPLVATDFSPRVLQRDRQRLEALGLYDRVSLLAFDARRTPFKDGAVRTLTSNLGLPNIESPGALLQELRRIVGGTFLAISHFYPEDDQANAAVIHQADLSALLFRRSALEGFAAAGWQVEVANVCRGAAHPTPPSVLLEGATIDGLPVAETTLEWCVLVAC